MLACQQADRSGNTLNQAENYFEQTKNGTESEIELRLRLRLRVRLRLRLQQELKL